MVLAEAGPGRDRLMDVTPFAIVAARALLRVGVLDRLDEQLLRAPRVRHPSPTRRGCINISFLGFWGVVVLRV